MNPFKATNPVTVTKAALDLAGASVGLAGIAVHQALRAPVGVARGAVDLAGAAAGLAGSVARETVHVLWPDEDAQQPVVDDTAEVPAEAVVVPREPRVPEAPPVDVVGAALAAERAGRTDGAGLAHEPHGSSRDEEHGEAPLQRAEVDEIAEEAAAALEGDVEPEEHLAQPLVDPAETKAVASELATMSNAAARDKG